ncbi:unnamed protein product [Prunus armeniaca]
MLFGWGICLEFAVKVLINEAMGVGIATEEWPKGMYDGVGKILFSLSGESEPVNIYEEKPFLLSGTKVQDGSGGEDETPLQLKLNGVATIIVRFLVEKILNNEITDWPSTDAVTHLNYFAIAPTKCGKISVSISLKDELSVYRPPPTNKHTEVQAIEKQKEQDRLMQFLMGLNDSYNAVQGQLLLMKPLSSVREAYNFVTQEEKQREIGNNSIAENFSVQRLSEISRIPKQIFRYCKKDTHKIETCPKLHGYPPGHPRHDPNFKSKARQPNQGNSHRQGQHMDQFLHHAFHAIHATPNAAANAVGSQSTNGYNPHGSTSILSSHGSINTSDSHPFQAIIPGLFTKQYNQLTTAIANMAHLPKGNIDAYANAARLYNYLSDLATGKMIGWGKQSGGLYFMSPVRKSSTVCHTTASSTIWHHRLGHPFPACLRLVSKDVRFHETTFPFKPITSSNPTTVFPPTFPLDPMPTSHPLPLAPFSDPSVDFSVPHTTSSYIPPAISPTSGTTSPIAPPTPALLPTSLVSHSDTHLVPHIDPLAPPIPTPPPPPPPPPQCGPFFR